MQCSGVASRIFDREHGVALDMLGDRSTVECISHPTATVARKSILTAKPSLLLHCDLVAENAPKPHEYRSAGTASSPLPVCLLRLPKTPEPNPILNKTNSGRPARAHATHPPGTFGTTTCNTPNYQCPLRLKKVPAVPRHC